MAYEIASHAEKLKPIWKRPLLCMSSNKSAIFHPENEKFNKLIEIKSENMRFDISKNGGLFYKAPEGYEGDQKGFIPSSYPKGYTSYYIMKYELTEGQYVDFMYITKYK